MKILKRSSIGTRYLLAGDTLKVVWKDDNGEESLAEHTLDATQAMAVDEALVFETLFEERRALGGMVLEAKKDQLK